MVVGFQRLPIPVKWRRVIEVVCVVVLVAVVAVAGFGAAVKVVSTTNEGEQDLAQRSLLADLTTPTGRTGAYMAPSRHLCAASAGLAQGL